MRVESRIHVEGVMHRFEIVDADDTIISGEDILCESLHLCEKSYANEDTAERHANKWLDKFRSASESVRRKLCGFDPLGTCKSKPPVSPVRRRVGP